MNKRQSQLAWCWWDEPGARCRAAGPPCNSMRVEGRAECHSAAALQEPGFSRSLFHCKRGKKGQSLGEELQVLPSFQAAHSCGG